MIILIVVPVMLRVIGAVCSKTDRKGLFCAAFAAALFCVTGLGTLDGLIGADAEKYSLLVPAIGGIGFDALGNIGASPAYLLIMKICSAFSTESFVFPLVIACIQTALAVYAVFNRCSSPYSGAAVLTFCFIPAYFAGSAAFTAALIAVIASGYIEEQRFFRFAALMFAAACFDMSALLLIPVCAVMFFGNIVIATAVPVILAVLAALFPEAVTAVFGFLGADRCTTADMPVACAVIACAAAASALLIYKMLANRSGDHERLVPAIVCGAAFSVVTVSEPELFAFTQMLLMMSAVVLAPEAFDTGEKFVGIVFPEKRETSQTVFLIVCAAAETAICAYLVLGNVFGSDVFETSFLAGVQL
ncbi:MAG: EpsG family protein [Ruminiclostridium sp.]|nr:EpsG family protein [Ruminiclostridium sp.]